MNNLLTNIQGWIQNGPMGNVLNDIENAHITSGGLGQTAVGAGNRSWDVFVPEVWAPAVELAFKDKLVFANLCQDLSAFVSSGGDKIHIPQFDQVATGTKAINSPIGTYGNDMSAQTELTLEVDQHKYSATLVEDVLKVQSNYDIMNIYAQEMGYALAKEIDTYLEGQLLASCQTADGDINSINVGADLYTASNADFDLVLQNVLAEDQDPSNWTLVLSPTAYAGLARLVQLSYGTAGSPLGQGFANSGQVATVFGMPVLMSNAVTTARTDMDSTAGDDDHDVTPIGYCVHKSAMHIAYSSNIRMQADYDIDYLGTKVVSDVMYGCLVRNASTAGQKRVFILGTVH
tara:strand:+ start:870 stop:1907 length:1038 start_codon:yes stop_codon:yes gene_type:complete